MQSVKIYNMALLLVFLMMAQTIFAESYRVMIPESKMTCEEKGSTQKYSIVDTQQECEELCDNLGEDCNTIFLSYKKGDPDRCYPYKSCNYLTTNNGKLYGTTFSKQPKPHRDVADADYFYNHYGIDGNAIDGACALTSDDSWENIGSVEVAEKMEDCQYLCDLSVDCTGYWWREGNRESPDHCVLYEEPIKATQEDRGKCMIREFHPLTPAEDVATLLKLIPKRLEKLVVKVRRSAKRSDAWCEDAEDETRGKDNCAAYSSIVEELLKLPLGGRNVMLKKEDDNYDVGNNPIRVVATQLRALTESKVARAVRNSKAVNQDGKVNRHVQEILNVAKRWGVLCRNDFLEPLERITDTDKGRYSFWHINSNKKHDTRNVVLLEQVLQSLDLADEDFFEDFYWMEPLLLAYHTLAEHYNTIIGRPLQDGSWYHV